MSESTFETFSPRMRPLQAAGALARFLRCKEATYEVFRLLAALDGPVSERNFQRFAATALGARVLRERTDLKDALMDRAALAALPDGTLGRAYLDFVTREGLSAEAFQREMDASGESYRRAGEDRRRYLYRLRHTHDLFHVITGYGRDFVGELSLLAFTRQHNHSRGLVPLIVLGYFKARREYPGMHVWSCIREGSKLGRAAADLIVADWEALLAQPLTQVRRELRIGVPRRYLAVKPAAETLDRRYREELTGQPVA